MESVEGKDLVIQMRRFPIHRDCAEGTLVPVGEVQDGVLVPIARWVCSTCREEYPAENVKC